MPEKKFYLESSSPLQEIGMRAQVISFLIAQGIKKGNAINDSANKNRVIVAIEAEDENRIREIKEALVNHLNPLHTNDFCYPDFPSDISASELYELNNPRNVIILPLSDLANSLMLEQTGKGVGAIKYLASTLESLKNLPAILENLTKRLNL
jgi:hypothetical protein